MGDKAALSKARQELEDLYLGVPDESVDLTFKDFATAQQSERKKVNSMEPIREHESPGAGSRRTSMLEKLPSVDLAKGLQHSKARNHVVSMDSYSGGHLSPVNNRRGRSGMSTSNAYECSRAYEDDLSVMTGVSMRDPYVDGVRRKRPGVPHSNICTICCLYIYFFRHRCLVCGRVYCRDCVKDGMGEMTEGRKCLQCLGRRFSNRYIHKAGSVGCWMSYPSRVKQQELRWAEKGSRRSGEKQYGASRYMSRTRSPEMPRTPRSTHSNGGPVSFSMSPILLSPIHPHFPV